MFETKAIKICILLLGSFVCGIKSECSITVDGDAPVFSKTLGSKTLILRNGQRRLTLKSGETLRADCPRQISVRENLEDNRNILNENVDTSSVTLKCDWSPNYARESFSYKMRGDYSYRTTSYPSISLNCIQGKRKLYERYVTLPSCGLYTTYIIGTQSAWRDPIVSASICFDWSNLAVKYVKYLPNRAEYEFSDYKDAPKGVLGSSAPIERFDRLFKDSNTFDISIELYKKSNQLLSLHQFDYASLLQDPGILAELNDFSYIFKTIWWSNLRLGTWKFFLEALASRTEPEKYEMYIGTSGVLTIPSSIECKQFEEFTVVHEGREVRAPEFIWAYLRPIKENETEEEFVIIGHNTPFSSAAKSMQFCKDMCHEINWLNGTLFSKVHLTPTFGIVECCHPSEVQAKLTGFPVDLLKGTETTTENEVE